MANQNVQHDDPTPKEIAEIAKMGPAFNDKTMKSMEAGAAHPSRGIDRRTALVVCSKSIEQLLEISDKDPVAFGEIVDGCNRFEAHARALLDVAKAASLRARLADNRTDSLKVTS